MFQMQNKREQTPDATGKPAVALEEGAEGRVDAADKGDHFQEEKGRTTGCTCAGCLFTKEKPGVREHEQLEKFTGLINCVSAGSDRILTEKDQSLHDSFPDFCGLLSLFLNSNLLEDYP